MQAAEEAHGFIKKNFLFGCLSRQVTPSNGYGVYIHDWRKWWRQIHYGGYYGMVPVPGTGMVWYWYLLLVPYRMYYVLVPGTSTVIEDNAKF